MFLEIICVKHIIIVTVKTNEVIDLANLKISAFETENAQKITIRKNQIKLIMSKIFVAIDFSAVCKISTYSINTITNEEMFMYLKSFVFKALVNITLKSTSLAFKWLNRLVINTGKKDTITLNKNNKTQRLTSAQFIVRDVLLIECDGETIHIG